MSSRDGWRRVGVLLGLTLVLSACTHHSLDGDEEGINTYPAGYKSDILGAVHAYLNDPTGIRDAALSEPLLKSVASRQRYVACVRFNAKQSNNGNAGVKELAAVFLAGHFDQFVEKATDLCAGVTYAPFPELEKLPR